MFYYVYIVLKMTDFPELKYVPILRVFQAEVKFQNFKVKGEKVIINDKFMTGNEFSL